ncbi:MAG TPA: YwiC-like family protein [Candidatus Nanopelagicaceae bacterium]
MKFPPQHGAWAFLIVPAIIVSFLGAGNATGLIFFLAWVSGYPVSYFLGRALVMRIRRGKWSSKAKAELRFATPWLVITLVGIALLLVLRPWLIVYGLFVAAIWAISIYLSWAGRERGITNDLLLVGLASMEPVLMYQVAKNHSSLHGLPHGIWIAALMSMIFFAGSVIHVKSLIREVKNRNWHRASLVYHLVVLVLLMVYAKPWYLAIPFALALVRTILVKPGLRPGTLGVVELGVSIALITCTVIATV